MSKTNTAARSQHMNQYKPLIKELILRDLKIKYRRSVLGYLWSLLNPLLMMAVMTMVFSYMFRFDIPNFPLYLICGQTLWSFFNESTTVAMHSVLANGSLIRKVYIPKYIFPISRVLSSFVTMSFSLVAIVIVMLVSGVPLRLSLLMIPVPLVLLLLFCIGISMMLSVIVVYFRDVIHLYSVLTIAWTYLTPIFYPLSALPEDIARIVKCNPMYHYITFFRELVLYGGLPSSEIWIGCIGYSLLAVALGFAVFHKLQKNVILYV